MSTQILGGTAIAIAIALLIALFRDLGYKAGVKDGRAAGYEAGRKDEQNWWFGIESDADQARRQIWKEGINVSRTGRPGNAGNETR